jgi:amino acid adenylation domain-containing protein
LIRASILRLATEEHVLLIGAHHLVCDGWSWNILFNEIARLYSARVQGRECLLPAALPFSEFARLQEEARTGPEYAAAEKYWLGRFAEPPPPLDLPTDHPRTIHTGNQGAREEIHLSRELLYGLRKAGAKQGATLFVVLLSAIHVLLQRLSGQNKSVVAICSAGQNRPGAERVVGHCVNLLPIYGTSEKNQPFTRFVGEIKELMQAAHDHDHYTYGNLLEKLPLSREPKRPPLINAVLTMSPEGDIPFEGLQVSEQSCPKSRVNFDLMFGVCEDDTGLVIELNYNRDLFAAETVQRWLGHFHAMLDGIAGRPDTPVAALPLLGAKERQRMLFDWNDTAMACPPVCLHELFEARVREQPEVIALVAGHERLTYAELNRRANRVAHHLRDLGVGPESLVGIFMKRSADMVCAMMGVLKAGGAYVPMDPEYPADRIAYMLADSRAHTVLTQEKLAGTLRDFMASLSRVPHCVCVDTDEQVAFADISNPRVITRPENLCYVFYTSGSTGRPKGVALEHRNSVAFVQWAGVVFDAQQLDGVLASTSICFDLSVFELFVTLGHGGKVILAPTAIDLPSLPAANEVRLIVTVPSILRELLRMKGLPSSLTTVTTAGEFLPVELVRQLSELPHVQKVWDLYGPTETTTYSTFTLRAPDKPATIGRPIANTRVYILDEQLQPVPVGSFGELFIGGAGVAREYLNQPELTAQRFLPDPFTGNPEDRMYRTGDLCRYRADGTIEYAGRIDHQIKIRGLRVELGEIESILLGHPGVSEAVVVAREDSPGKQSLVAYLARHSPAASESESDFVADVRRRLEARLPRGMVPEAILVLDRLPLTPNGKVDRKALPVPAETSRIETSSATTAPEHVAPRTLTEETLSAIWSELLERNHFGVHDDFFQLGGHSLVALRLISRVREALQIELPIKAVFQSPTIAGLATIVDQILLEEIGALSEEEALSASNDLQQSLESVQSSVSKEAPAKFSSDLTNGG